MLFTSLTKAFALTILLPQVVFTAAVPGNLVAASTTTLTTSTVPAHELFDENKSQPPGPRGHPKGDGRREDRIDSSKVVGEPNGKPFSDQSIVSGHKRLHSITLYGCEKGMHLSYIGMSYRSAEGATGEVAHGSVATNATPSTLTLKYGERVVTIASTTWAKKFRKSHRTRLGWIKFVTNFGNILECGSMLESDVPNIWWSRNNEEALLYLSGSSGDAIDALQGHFIPMQDY